MARFPDPKLLDELIAKCRRQGEQLRSASHCAICVRYQNDNLAFQALLAHVDALPSAKARDLVTELATLLVDVPARYRNQPVTDNNFSEILDAPSWPLIGSLTIDLFGLGIARIFDDPRLVSIEEIMLLGGAYGGPDVSPEFMRVLVESSSLVNVRRLSLHSGDFGEESRKIFWGSTFAAKLEEIDGIPYCNEPTVGMLNANTIRGIGCWDDVCQRRIVPAVLDPEVSPKLQQFSMSMGYRQFEDLAEFVEGVAPQLERLAHAKLEMGDAPVSAMQKVSKVRLADHVEVEWRPETEHHDLTLSHRFEYLRRFRADKGDGELIVGGSCVSEYAHALLEYDLLVDASTKLKRLKVIVPPDESVSRLIESLSKFRWLEDLMVVYPFTLPQAKALLNGLGDALNSLELVLFFAGNAAFTEGNQGENPPCSPSEVCQLLHGAEAGGIEHLSIVGETIELARHADRLQLVRLGSTESVAACVDADSTMPLDVLSISASLEPSDVLAIGESGILSRVDALRLEEAQSEASMALLAEQECLGTIQEFTISGYKDLTLPALEAILGSEYWKNIVHFGCSTDADGAERALANCQFLHQLVSLGIRLQLGHAGGIVAGKKLPLLRQLDESLTSEVLGDARVARDWLEAGLSTPLRAEISTFIERMYSQDDHRTIEQIEADLRSLASSSVGYDEAELRFGSGVRALLASAFREPVSRGTPFAALSPVQKKALLLVQELGKGWWTSDDTLTLPMSSYGFDFHEEQFDEFISGDRHSE